MVAPPAIARSRSRPAERSRLGDLYAHVERANPRIAAANALATAARARVPGTRRPPDPQLQLGFMNYTLPGLAPMEVFGMTQLLLMQMVPLGGKLRAPAAPPPPKRRGRASSRATSSGASHAAAMAFYDLYAVDGRLAVARETLRLLQDIDEPRRRCIVSVRAAKRTCSARRSRSHAWPRTRSA